MVLVTRFVTSPPTDNCPQPKEALPAVSTSTLPYSICLTPRLRSLMVRKWSTVPISLSYTTSALTHLLAFGFKETKPAPWVSGSKTGPSYLIQALYTHPWRP
jgi:hypothetical protein